MHEAEQLFLDQSRQLLLQDYLPKVEHCVSMLGDDALWWRPNENTNAVGNLLLHLTGNVRQWILHGVGGASCTRHRASEFNATGGADAQALLHGLRSTCAQAGAVLSEVDAASLTERRVIQGVEVSVLGAIYHALEHFSGHLGQILYITKLRTGKDLRFWVIGEEGAIERGWRS